MVWVRGVFMSGLGLEMGPRSEAWMCCLHSKNNGFLQDRDSLCSSHVIKTMVLGGGGIPYSDRARRLNKDTEDPDKDWRFIRKTLISK